MRRRTLYNGLEPFISGDYLCFTATEPGTFTLTIPAGVDSTVLQSVSYCVNKKGWNTIKNTDEAIVITTPELSEGDKVYWKGEGNAYAISLSVYSKFSSSGEFAASGNILSLLYGNGFEAKKSLKGADYSFTGLFRSSKMTTAPTLPATSLANGCYNFMFYGCTSLNYIKAMFTTSASATYSSNWVYGVPRSGTFVKNSAATWNYSDVNTIPPGWTVETASEQYYIFSSFFERPVQNLS